MTAHRVTYQGPPALAVRAATLLADAAGIQLLSAGSPRPRDGAGGEATLTLTVEGTAEAVAAAVERVRADLPAQARLTVVEAPSA